MIPLNRFLPQGEYIASLMQQIRGARLTHAILITGEAGVGKWSLAGAIAAALLCEGEEKDRIPCGKCRACLQMETFSHPDVTVLEKGKPLTSKEAKTVIPVEDVQEAIHRVGLKGFESERRIIMIHHAEDMSEQAQNKLLKTLEEPPEDAFFLLTSLNEERLLPTIVSRCRLLKIHAWPDNEIRRMLEEHGYGEDKISLVIPEAEGSFGRALQMAGDDSYWSFRAEVMKDFFSCTRRSDILSVSTRWKDRKEDADQLFSVMEHFISRVSRSSLGLDGGVENDPDCPEAWKRFAGTAETKDLVRLTEAVSLARKRVRFFVPFQAVTEQLILTFMEAVIT